MFGAEDLNRYRPVTALHADLILKNAKIATLDETGRFVSALAARGGRIVAMGEFGALEALAGPDTPLIDLQGRTAIPGIVDSHCHPDAYAARIARWQDLSPGIDSAGKRWIAPADPIGDPRNQVWQTPDRGVAAKRPQILLKNWAEKGGKRCAGLPERQIDGGAPRFGLPQQLGEADERRGDRFVEMRKVKMGRHGAGVRGWRLLRQWLAGPNWPRVGPLAAEHANGAPAKGWGPKARAKSREGET